jgi:hypothetical protein
MMLLLQQILDLLIDYLKKIVYLFLLILIGIYCRPENWIFRIDYTAIKWSGKIGQILGEFPVKFKDDSRTIKF